MPPLISAGTAASIRRVFGDMMAHTYAMTPVTEGSDDGYGPTRTEGTPVTGKPCSYRQTRRLRLDEGNQVTVDTPTLTVPYDDPIAVGDLVADVRDSDGVVLLVGPVRVETIEASAGLGPTLQRRAVLRGGDAV